MLQAACEVILLLCYPGFLCCELIVDVVVDDVDVDVDVVDLFVAVVFYVDNVVELVYLVVVVVVVFVVATNIHLQENDH